MKNKNINFYTLNCLLLTAIISLTLVFFNANDAIAKKKKKELIPPAKFYESFGHRFNNKWNVVGNPYMVIGLTDEIKARAGKYSVRAVVGKDYGRNSFMRAESGLKTAYGYKWMKQIPVGEDRWYGFSIFVPANFIPDVKGHQDIFFQLKDTDFRHLMLPVVALSIQEDHFNVTARGGKIKKTSWTDKATKDFGTVTPGAWNDFVVQVIIGDGKYGQLNVYHNGQHIFSHRGSVGRLDTIKTYSDELKPITKYRSYQAKIGLEKPEWRNKKGIERSAAIGIDYRILYFDELRVTDGRNSYEVVNPARKPVNSVLWNNNQKSKRTKNSKFPKPKNLNKSPAMLTKATAATTAIATKHKKHDIKKKTDQTKGKQLKINPSAKTTKPLKEVNSDGSPVIRQIELTVAGGKAQKSKPLTIKWDVKSDSKNNCKRSGSWSGTSSSKGEYIVKKPRTHTRYEITCGWGKGEVSKTLMLVPNPKQSKLQYNDNSITFIELK